MSSTTRKRVNADKPASGTPASPGKAKAAKGKKAPRGKLLSPPLRLLAAILGLACLAFLISEQLPYLQHLATQYIPGYASASPPLEADARSSSQPKKPPTPPGQLPFEAKRNLPFLLADRPLPSAPIRTADELRRDAIRLAFTDSWAAYVHDAWGKDEYHPLSHGGTNLGSAGPVGYTIVDTLDTLLLMGLQEEYAKARDWVRDELNLDQSGKFNVFETTIRILGGLLSAQALCTQHPQAMLLCDEGDAQMYLERAVMLGDRLKPAFEATKTGIPLREVDLKTGKAYADTDNYGMASLAEATTIQLEFKYLAHLTNDESYWTLAERPMRVARHATTTSTQDGLLPIFVEPNTGTFYMSEIRLGSRGDSYYEYLLKQWLQTNRSEDVYRDMYDRAMAAIKKHLVQQSTFSKLLYTNEVAPRRLPGHDRPIYQLVAKQDHLVCFLGGSLMLGSLSSSPSTTWLSSRTDLADLGQHAQEDWSVGHGITAGCYDTYRGTKTGLAPEIAFWRMKHEKEAEFEDWWIKTAPLPKDPSIPRPSPLVDARNILRPETLESLYIAFHLSGDPIYREWGWKIFEAFVRHARIEESGAFASVKNVMHDWMIDGKVELEDRMETFWLSESLKYLFLLFSDQDVLPLDKWVLNTEAHPLPVFTPTFATTLK